MGSLASLPLLCSLPSREHEQETGPGGMSEAEALTLLTLPCGSLCLS